MRVWHREDGLKKDKVFFSRKNRKSLPSFWALVLDLRVEVVSPKTVIISGDFKDVSQLKMVPMGFRWIEKEEQKVSKFWGSVFRPTASGSFV